MKTRFAKNKVAVVKMDLSGNDDVQNAVSIISEEVEVCRTIADAANNMDDFETNPITPEANSQLDSDPITANPELRSVITWRINCQICDKTVADYNALKQIHVFSHLKRETGISSLFECNICAKQERQWQTVYYAHLYNHLMKKHDVSKPIVDDDYLDKTKAYSAQIERTMKKCFGSSVRIEKTTYTMKRRPKPYVRPSRVECTKCQKSISSVPKEKRKHSLIHLRSEKGIKWIYRCLLCSKNKRRLQTLWFNTLKGHLTAIHRRFEKPSLGRNYMSRKDQLQDSIAKMTEECFGDTKNRPTIARKPTGPRQPNRFRNTNVQRHLNSIRRSGVKRELLLDETCTEIVNDVLNLTNPTKRKRTVLQCSKCFEFSDRYLLKPHCLKHLKEESKIAWAYKCLLCEDGKYINYSAVKTHVFSHHGIKVAKPDIDFLDRTKTDLNKIITKTIYDCFKIEFGKAVKFPIIKRRPFVKDMVCNLCGKSIADNFNSLKQHSIGHIKHQCGIEWFYKCLLCFDKKSLKTFRRDSIIKHMSVIHNIDSPECNEHYADQIKECAGQINEILRKCFPDM